MTPLSVPRNGFYHRYGLSCAYYQPDIAKDSRTKRDAATCFSTLRALLKQKKPVGFLLENVKNLKTHDKGNTFKVIEKTLTDLGYHIKTQVLNSMDYGNVPQNRERIYIVGFKDEKIANRFEFPKPIKLTKDVRSVLDKEVDDKYYYNDKPLYERIKDDIVNENVAYQWRRQYVRSNKKGVFPTLTANMGMGGHNVPIIVDSVM